jgi:type IV pilus assembly protein PilW
MTGYLPLRTHQRRRAANQRGMTLIEFMVGSTLGLLVALAAVGSIVITRSSARSMTDSAALEQQATLVMTQIGQQITQAGAINAYLPGNGADAGISGGAGAIPVSAATSPNVMFDTRNIGISGNPAFSVFGQSVSNAPDKLTITYAQPNDRSGKPAQNCVGTGAATLPGAAPRVVNIFSVNTTTHSLLCGSDNPKTSPQPIASNVVDMRITYLLVDAATGKVAYRTANQITTANQWPSVNGIQVCLEVQGDPAQAPEQKIETDCQNNARDITDGRIHRIVRQTFYLRNTN